MQRDRVIVRAQPTVEAIPKADYENRLKADMVSMLTEIQMEIEELKYGQPIRDYVVDECSKIIQQKIDKLEESEDGANTD